MRRETLAVGLAGLLSALALARPAAAACTNDVDCPTATCGGQVCKWAASGHTCVAAGTDPQGTDGWCTVDSDCKCKAEGATCAAPHCTFTVASEGGAPGADASGGSSSSGGYSSGGGSSSSGGGGGSGGPATIPDSSVTSGSTTPGGSGGCALGGSRSTPGRVALALACAAALAFARRRRD